MPYVPVGIKETKKKKKTSKYLKKNKQFKISCNINIRFLVIQYKLGFRDYPLSRRFSYRDGPVIATALFSTLQVLQSRQLMKNWFPFSRLLPFLLFLNMLKRFMFKKAKYPSFIYSPCPDSVVNGVRRITCP